MLPVGFEPSGKIGPLSSGKILPGFLLFLANIAFNVILPIFVVMALGFLVSKYFTLDLGSLSKLNFHIFIPVFMFYNLLIFQPAQREMGEVVAFNLVLAGATFIAVYGLTRLLKFESKLAAASTLAVMVFNSANYGIPVINLALKGDESIQGQGLAIQVITITTMNVITYTLGVLIMGGWSEWKKGVQTILKLPILYALLAAILIRQLNLDLPEAVMTPLKWTSDGMLPVALLTLGAQLGQGGISLRHPREIGVTVAARLFLAPLLAFGLIYAFGWIHLMNPHGLLARVLFISSAFPTAVTTVLFGIEYDKEPTFAADVVLLTTLLSALTVTGAISLSTVLF